MLNNKLIWRPSKIQNLYMREFELGTTEPKSTIFPPVGNRPKNKVNSYFMEFGALRIRKDIEFLIVHYSSKVQNKSSDPLGHSLTIRSLELSESNSRVFSVLLNQLIGFLNAYKSSLPTILARPSNSLSLISFLFVVPTIRSLRKSDGSL